MNLQEIESLPDILPTETIALMFQNALNKFGNNKIEKKEFLLILSQLTDRQVMTYELLKSEVRNNIDQTLSKLWNTDSYDEVDIILSIVVNLGLGNCFHKIKEAIKHSKDIDELILTEILETIAEVGENISNPHHSLERFR